MKSICFPPPAFCLLPTAFEGSSSWRDFSSLPRPGTGVICETRALQAAVIPVPPWREESTRQTFGNTLSTDWIPPAERDGNEWRFERDPIPNDTTTRSPRQDVTLAGKEETLVTLRNEGTKREYY